MKMSTGFTKAAELVFNSIKRVSYRSDLYRHLPGCIALMYSGLLAKPSKYRKAKCGFSTVFDKGEYDYWFGYPYYLLENINTKRANHRIFALLLMAELAKDIGE